MSLLIAGESPYGLTPDESSSVLLGGQELPGIATIKAPKRGIKLDIKKAKGSSGATFTVEGYDPAKIEIEIVVWTLEQIQLMSEITQLIEPDASKGLPQPLTIYHEFTFARAITDVIIESLEGPGNGSKPGEYVYKISAYEWRPEFAGGKGTGSTTPKSAKGNVTTVFDDAVSQSGYAGPPPPPKPTAAGPPPP